MSWLLFFSIGVTAGFMLAVYLMEERHGA